jgi:hypothetical protein
MIDIKDMFRSRRQNPFERFLPMQQRQGSQVLAVQPQQIKGEVVDVVTL